MILSQIGKKKKKKETEMQVVKVLRDVLRHQLTSVLL